MCYIHLLLCFVRPRPRFISIGPGGRTPRDESTFALSFPWYLLFPCFPVLPMNLSKRHGNRGPRPLPKRDCKDTPFFHSTKTFFNFFMIFSNFFSRKTTNRQPASNDIIYKVCRKNSVCSRKGLAFFMWKAGICASQRVPERGTELPAEKTRHETIRRDFTPAAEDITFAIDSNKSINSTIKILYDYPQKYPLCVYGGGGESAKDLPESRTLSR